MKPIKITEDMRLNMLHEFEQQLKTARIFNGQFEFKKSFAFDKEAVKDLRATIHYTPEAFVKTWALVRHFSTEVAWHNLVRRVGETEFEVYDTIVYDQVVTGGTVNTDQQKYTDFLMSLSKEQLNDLHMQGHSHVNMATSPSSVDLSHQQQTISLTPEDSFYIFTIWNKSMENFFTIFDLKNNIVYEKKDIDVDILLPGNESIYSFVDEADKRVTKSTPPATAYGTKYQYVDGQWKYIPDTGKLPEKSSETKAPAAQAKNDSFDKKPKKKDKKTCTTYEEWKRKLYENAGVNTRTSFPTEDDWDEYDDESPAYGYYRTGVY